MKKIILIFLSLLLLTCGKEKHPYSESSLSEFIYKNELPAGCLRYSTGGGTVFPPGIASNPYLSSNPKFLKSFAGQLLNYDRDLTATVTTALFSVFEGEHEIGLFGLEFRSAQSAKAAEERLKADIPDVNRFRIFRKNALLLQLWSVDTSDSCFVSLSVAVSAKLNS